MGEAEVAELEGLVDLLLLPMRVLAVADQLVEGSDALLVQEVGRLGVVPLQFAGEVVLAQFSLHVDVTDLLQPQVLVLELRAVHPPQVLQLLLLLFGVDGQQTDQPLLHLLWVVELESGQQGGVVLEGEVADEEDDLEVGRERGGLGGEGGHSGEELVAGARVAVDGDELRLDYCPLHLPNLVKP